MGRRVRQNSRGQKLQRRIKILPSSRQHRRGDQTYSGKLRKRRTGGRKCSKLAKIQNKVSPNICHTRQRKTIQRETDENQIVAIF